MELVDENHLRMTATRTTEKFIQLNTLYSRIHAKISHSRPMTENEIDTLDSDIKQYMYFYRRKFPSQRIIPKQHILEQHCVPFIRRYGFGLGLHGEQGGEETHAVVNRLKRRAWGMKNEAEKLRVIMTEHMAIVSPTLQTVTQSVNKVRTKALPH